MNHTVTITRRERVEIEITPKEAIDLLRGELDRRLNAELASLKVLSRDELPADGYYIKNEGGKRELIGWGGRKPRDWSFKVEWGSIGWIARYDALEKLEAALKP